MTDSNRPHRRHGLRTGAVALVASASALTMTGPAGATGNTPESLACRAIDSSVPGGIVRAVATRTEDSPVLSTLTLTLTRDGEPTTAWVLDCMWFDDDLDGQLGYDEKLFRTAAERRFSDVGDGTAATSVAERTLPTGGPDQALCGFGAIVVPVDETASSDPSVLHGYRVLSVSNIACSATLPPVISEASEPALMAATGLAAAVGGGALLTFARRIGRRRRS
jgi:hypothetical protein